MLGGSSQVSQWSRILLSIEDMQKTQVRSLGQEDTLKEEMATHSNILAWEIPWTEEPSRLHPWSYKESGTTEHMCMHMLHDISFSSLKVNLKLLCIVSKSMCNKVQTWWIKIAEVYSLTVLEARNLKPWFSRAQESAGPDFLKRLQGRVLSGFSYRLGVSGNPWFPLVLWMHCFNPCLYL